jgi:hypothetical protein
MNMRNVLTIVYFVLTMYSFSGGLVHGVANYSLWKLISAEDFPVVHKYVNRRILAVYVPFFPERCGQHLTDLVSPSCDLHNVGGYRGGS